MTTVLEDVKITRYEVPVELVLDEYNNVDNLKDDIIATAVNAIVNYVSDGVLDSDVARDDARPHIERRVTYDEEHVQDVFEADDADVLTVETVTQLGQLPADQQ